ncbi:Acetyltransferase component of pyruvate dehydrogenase complex [Balamuthia mandrillaris]
MRRTATPGCGFLSLRLVTPVRRGGLVASSSSSRFRSASSASFSTHAATNYFTESYPDARPHSPAVQTLLHLHHIADASRIPATGPKGRLLKGDVLAFLSSPSSASVSSAASASSLAAAAKKDTKTAAPSGISSSSAYDDLPNSNMRKVIAKRLSESKRTVPHLYINAECNIDRLVQARKVLIEQAGIKVSVNDFIIKAFALALRQVPEANASWIEPSTGNGNADGAIRRHQSVDISVAVATEGGLITPIVRQADSKGLLQISKEVQELAGRARQNKLKPEEFQGGTASISNLGMFGIHEFSAVINPPQGCILAIGQGRQEVVAASSPSSSSPSSFAEEFKVCTKMNVSLSCDNRVMDEEVAARLLSSFQKLIADPSSMLL